MTGSSRVQSPIKPGPSAVLLAVSRAAIAILVLCFVVTVLYRFSVAAIGVGIGFVVLVELGLWVSERSTQQIDRAIWIARVAGSALIAAAVVLGLVVALQIGGHALLALIGSLFAYVLLVLFSPLIMRE